MQMWGGNDPNNNNNGSPLSLPGYNTDDSNDDRAISTPLTGIQLPDLSNVDVC